MDAFAVSVGKGLTTKKVTMRHALLAGVWFGGFQALMPVFGYFLGGAFSTLVSNIDHWIAFVLLVYIGLNMIRETVWGDDDKLDANFGFRTMLIMAVATSIDALVVGVTMAFFSVDIVVAATVIGVITFVISAAGVYLGACFGAKIGSKAGILGGVILISLGIKILLEHLL